MCRTLRPRRMDPGPPRRRGAGAAVRSGRVDDLAARVYGPRPSSHRSASTDVGSERAGKTAAARAIPKVTTVVAVPIVAVFIGLQRYIVGGLTLGGIIE